MTGPLAIEESSPWWSDGWMKERKAGRGGHTTEFKYDREGVVGREGEESWRRWANEYTAGVGREGSGGKVGWGRKLRKCLTISGWMSGRPQEPARWKHRAKPELRLRGRTSGC